AVVVDFGTVVVVVVVAGLVVVDLGTVVVVVVEAAVVGGAGAVVEAAVVVGAAVVDAAAVVVGAAVVDAAAVVLGAAVVDAAVAALAVTGANVARDPTLPARESGTRMAAARPGRIFRTSERRVEGAKWAGARPAGNASEN
ncbi:MAG: hypothetical protein J2P58_00300, partial [Acidimicrobiaceae bacterium]|nr:hypothetical protein [Acidimicrobiaceae bacterium]